MNGLKMDQSGTGRVVRKIPASDHGPGLIYKALSGAVYRISQCPEIGRHTLWKVLANGNLKRVATADSPLQLYEVIDKEEGRA